MTNYEWLIDKKNMVEALSTEGFVEGIISQYCEVCPDKLLCEAKGECQIDSKTIIKNWLTREHKE